MNARRRIGWVAGATALAAVTLGLAWWWLPHREASAVAARVAGERWYVVAFRHTPVGQYHTASGITPAGDFEFRTALRFAFDAATERREEVRLVFERWPPHRLREAERIVQTGDTEVRVDYRDGIATLTEAGHSRQLAVPLDFRLVDHLAVEQWLASTDAKAGDHYQAPELDLDRLQVAPVSWRVLDRDAESVAVARGWPPGSSFGASGAAASRVTLDSRHMPLSMEVDEMIRLQRVADRAAASAWRRQAPLFAAASHVTVDRAIARPAAVRALTVAVDREAVGSAWPATLAADVDAPRTASAGEIAAATAPTVRYPADDAQLKRLARRAVGDLEQPAEQAAALTRFVHNHLRYRDTATARTVLDTVRDRAGDCTEYADLFTTLARSLHLPARTVVGLAYRADQQAFVLHAWNEVAIDERWQGMDPTWDQPRLDATHLALPAKAALAAIVELPQLRFRILETRY